MEGGVGTEGIGGEKIGEAVQKSKGAGIWGQNKVIFLILAASMVVLVVAFSVRMYFSDTNPISKCNKIILQYSKDRCFLGLAQNTLNVSICRFISEEGVRAQCIANLSVETKNLSICKMESNPSIQTACAIYFMKVYTNTSCKDLEFNQYSSDLCYYNLAKSKLNISECQKIKDVSMKENCNFTVLHLMMANSTDYKICDSFSDFSKAICIWTVSQNINKKLNSNISAINLNNQTISFNNLSLSQVLEIIQALNLQKNITNVSQLENLIKSYVNSSINMNLSALEKFGYAINASNPDYCNSLSNQTQRETCFFYLAVKTLNPDYCNYVGQYSNECKQILSFISARKTP